MKLELPYKIKDDRGYIQDLLTNDKFDAVTLITMRKGAIRGNHYHKLTTQWTFIINGVLEIATKKVISDKIVIDQLCADEMHLSAPNVCHGLRALEDCKILIITKGPRAGFDYESDTFRLEKSMFE